MNSYFASGFQLEVAEVIHVTRFVAKGPAIKSLCPGTGVLYLDPLGVEAAIATVVAAGRVVLHLGDADRSRRNIC